MGRFPAIETADRAKILAADRPDWFLLDQNWTSSAVPVVYRFLPYGRINAVIATETSVDEFFRHGSCMTARGPLCTDAIFPSHGRHIVAATGRRGRFLRAQRQELLSRSRWRVRAETARADRAFCNTGLNAPITGVKCALHRRALPGFRQEPLPAIGRRNCSSRM